jgi:hypothetical protein
LGENISICSKAIQPSIVSSDEVLLFAMSAKNLYQVSFLEHSINSSSRKKKMSATPGTGTDAMAVDDDSTTSQSNAFSSSFLMDLAQLIFSASADPRATPAAKSAAAQQISKHIVDKSKNCFQ